HTMSDRDWSSDVCSSDLRQRWGWWPAASPSWRTCSRHLAKRVGGEPVEVFEPGAIRAFFAERAAGVDRAELDVRDGLRWLAGRRSEERRGGKVCRPRRYW